MKDLINFLQERPDIQIRTIERSLKLPNATISTRNSYITPKHVEVIKKYLIKHFGYEENLKEAVENFDNFPAVDKNLSTPPDLSTPNPTLKMYNVGRIPGFQDNIHRFQDKQGLWRRITDNCMVTDKDKNTKVIKPTYQPQSDEILTDKIGSFYVANNGIKVYISYKPS